MIVTAQIVTFVAVHAFKCKYSKAIHVNRREQVKAVVGKQSWKYWEVGEFNAGKI